MASDSSSLLPTKFEWVEIKNTLNCPQTRSSHGISIINDTLYLYGGEHIARTPIDSNLYSFNFKDNIWIQCNVNESSSIPEPRVAHAQATIGNTICIFGGRQGIAMSEAPLNDLYSYNIETSLWTNLSQDSSGDIPCPRSFHKMLSIENKLYVFGGCGANGRLNDLYSYDTTTKVWSQLPSNDKIAGRGGAGFIANANGTSLYVIGGFAGKEMNDVFRYDINTKTWEEVHVHGESNNKIRPFSVSCSGLLNKKVFVFFGGEVDPSEKGHEGAGGFSNDCQFFDAETGKFIGDTSTQTNNNPSPMTRGWTSAAVLGDDKLVVFGGLSGDDEKPVRLNDLWMLRCVW